MSDRRVIQYKSGQDLLGPGLQCECAALRIVAAAGRALLDDDEGVLAGDRCLGTNYRFEPEEILARLRANNAFYFWRRGYSHMIGSNSLFGTIACFCSVKAIIRSWLSRSSMRECT